MEARLIPQEQRSEAWLEYRKNRIGGSDAPAIMELSPYCTRLKLWERKKGLVPEQPMNKAMSRGVEQEDEALEWLSMTTGQKYKSAVFSYKENDRLMASLDGINEAGDVIVEIKCSQKIFDMAKKGEIAPMYHCQMNHQMLVTGVSKCLFVAFDGFDGVIIEVPRDEVFIERMLEAELEFLEFLDTETPPPYGEDDHVKIILENEDAVNEYISLKQQITYLTSLEKAQKTTIESLGDSGNMELCSKDGRTLLKLTRVNKAGSVDWASLCKKHGISDKEVDTFRKSQIGYYKYSIAKR